MSKLNAPETPFWALLRQEPGPGEIFDRLPELETERLRLRRMRMRDAEALYEWTSDPEVARYVLWTAHRSVGETRDYLRYVRGLYRRGLPSSWGIELKEEGRMIGTIGVVGWFPDARSAEVGIPWEDPGGTGDTRRKPWNG